MDSRFIAYNTHQLSSEQFERTDYHLLRLSQLPYVFHNKLLAQLPTNTPGIYSLDGGRQIGKTTLLKQWMLGLLQSGVAPASIAFFTGELIDDHHQLVDLLQNYITEHLDQPLLYLIVDEITYINQWDKGIKFLADSGLFQRCIVMLTGSDLMLMQAARMTFPGRRGVADAVDFHLYPLSFKEVLELKKSIPELHTLISPEKQTPSIQIIQSIYREFNQYLQHGGYLTAINDMAREGYITRATLKTYSDWVRGDMLKRGKQEIYLQELLRAIIKRYNKQISWHTLADDLSIDSHKTVADYCELLSNMDVLFIQSALLLDKLVAAPKKARKLTLTDPFIYHAINYWLNGNNIDPTALIQITLDDSERCADLVESVVSNFYRRFYPTYYIKAEGEIDVAYVAEKTYWPIEVKWRNQLRPTDLKQIKKYPRAQVFAKTVAYGSVEGISIEPLPLALIKAESGDPD